MRRLAVVVVLVAGVLGGMGGWAVGVETAPYPRAPQGTGTAPLFAVADGSLSPADILLVEALSGGLARASTPRVYRVANNLTDNSDGYALWAQVMASKDGVRFNTTFLHDVPGLVQFFRPQLRGYVKCSMDTSSESVNAAITFLAAQNATTSSGILVAAGDAATQTLLGSTMGLPMVRDLSAATVAEVFGEFRGVFNKRLVSFQPPSKSAFVASYAIFSQAPTVEYKGMDGGPVAQAILSNMDTGLDGAALGWGPENAYVSELGKHSVYVHASDFSRSFPALSNLPIHSSLELRRPLRQPAHRAEAPAAGAPAPRANVHTVAFLMTDGDNLQWLMSGWATQSNWYGSPQRGQVPMGWTVSPAAAQLAPAVLDYAYGHATAADNFVAGPSGVGYNYPSQYKTMSSFAELTNTFLGHADMRIVNVISSLTNPDPQTVAALLAQPAVDAVLLYTYGSCYSGQQGKVWWAGDKPVITGRATLWNNGTSGTCLGIEAMANLLSSLPRDSSTVEGYSLVPVHAWSHTLADVVQLVQMLNASAAGGIEVVTPQQLVDRMRSSITSRCSSPSGSYTDSCSNCTMDSTSCILTCTCKAEHGKPPRQSQCNTDCCPDIANTDGVLTCGNAPCPMSCSAWRP